MFLTMMAVHGALSLVRRAYNRPKRIDFVFAFAILRRVKDLERAADLLHQTEAKLRGIVSEAASRGDYTSVLRITAWASAISGMVNGSVKERRESRLPTANERPSTRQIPRQDYPRFFRQGDQLIRIAWSKREKKEYRHKTPYGTLKSLVAAIAEQGADGRVFSTDQLFPIRVADGAEAPSYQVYVGISFLRRLGLIDQHGRQGYSISRADNFKDAIEVAWKSLPRE